MLTRAEQSNPHQQQNDVVVALSVSLDCRKIIHSSDQIRVKTETPLSLGDVNVNKAEK